MGQILSWSASCSTRLVGEYSSGSSFVHMERENTQYDEHHISQVRTVIAFISKYDTHSQASNDPTLNASQ